MISSEELKKTGLFPDGSIGKWEIYQRGWQPCEISISGEYFVVTWLWPSIGEEAIKLDLLAHKMLYYGASAMNPVCEVAKKFCKEFKEGDLPKYKDLIALGHDIERQESIVKNAREKLDELVLEYQDIQDSIKNISVLEAWIKTLKVNR
jgi:hypothetical protein